MTGIDRPDKKRDPKRKVQHERTSTSLLPEATFPNKLVSSDEKTIFEIHVQYYQTIIYSKTGFLSRNTGFFSKLYFLV